MRRGRPSETIPDPSEVSLCNMNTLFYGNRLAIGRLCLQNGWTTLIVKGLAGLEVDLLPGTRRFAGRISICAYWRHSKDPLRPGRPCGMDLQLRARLTGRRTLFGGCCAKKAFALAAAALLVCEHRLEFAAKAAGIVGLYPSPPENAPVISVDKKPSIQALESATGYVGTDSGKTVCPSVGEITK